MATEQTAQYNKLEKTLAYAGLFLFLLTVVAAIFSVWQNWDLTTSDMRTVMLNLRYSFHFLIVIGGGFGVWHALHWHDKDKLYAQGAFGGTVFSLLALIIYQMLDYVRLLLRAIGGQTSYQLDGFLFIGEPVIAVLLLFGIVFLLKGLRGVARQFQLVFCCLFVLLQLLVLVNLIPALGYAVWTADTLWILILGIVTWPLFVALAAHAVLSGVKDRLARAFYACIVGAMCALATGLLWEFSVNPEFTAAYIFSVSATVAALAGTVILVALCRRAVRQI